MSLGGCQCRLAKLGHENVESSSQKNPSKASVATRPCARILPLLSRPLSRLAPVWPCSPARPPALDCAAAPHVRSPTPAITLLATCKSFEACSVVWSGCVSASKDWWLSPRSSSDSPELGVINWVMAMVRAMVTTLLWPPAVTSCGGRLSTNLARVRPKSSCSSRSATSTSGSDESSQTPLQPYGALLLDVGGTLLETSQPVPEVYARIGAKYGVKATAADIKKGFKKAFSEPWPERLRYEGDGRPFWRFAVATATGCPDETYFEELYQHFARGDAWKLANGAPEALTRLRNAGVKLAVVSNFDSRLRPILRDLQVDTLFDALIISAEIGYEKPSPEIFEAALNELCVDAKVAVHVGDDPANDKQGALAAGLESWLWKVDVMSFEELADRVLQPATRTVR